MHCNLSFTAHPATTRHTIRTHPHVPAPMTHYQLHAHTQRTRRTTARPRNRSPPHAQHHAPVLSQPAGRST